MSGEGHPVDCPECTPCEEECGRAAWCLSEHPVSRPCEHLRPVCSECWPGRCIPCRLAAEREMFKTGAYSEAADPFLNHLAAQAVDRVERDGGYWWDGSWHAVPKMERRQ